MPALPVDEPPLTMDRATARAFCNELTETVDALVRVLDEETRLIRQARLSDASALSEEKARLGQRYGQAHATVKSSGRELGRHAPVEIAHLRRRHEALETAISNNLAVLATARTVSETLIRSVAESASPDAAQPKTYSSEARQAGAATPPARPLSLNVAL